MKLIKRIAWILKGSPRCKFCGKPIHKAKDISRGIGSGCNRKFEATKKQIDTDGRGNDHQNP